MTKNIEKHFKSAISHIANFFSTPIFVLLFLTVLTRGLLIVNTPAIYDFDSYTYLSKATDLASGGVVALEIGMPFVGSIAFLSIIFGSSLGIILTSRLFMVFLSVLVIYTIYSIGLRIAGKPFGFIASLFAIFEPFFLTYSIVPHNDVFVVAMGLLALYFAILNTRYSNILSLIFFYIAAFTRPEFFIVLLLPLLILFFYKFFKTVSKHGKLEYLFIIFAMFLPVVVVSNVYPALTRYGITEKLTLFLKPELFALTLDSLLNFYDQTAINNVILGFIGLGLSFYLLKLLRSYINLKREAKVSTNRGKYEQAKEHLFSEKGIIVICLCLTFIIHLTILTLYGYGYVIIDGEVNITTSFPIRYLILSRLILLYPLAYAFFILLKKVYIAIGYKERT